MFIRTFLWPAHPTAPMSFSIFHTLFNKYIKYIKNYIVWNVHTKCIYTQILLFLWLLFFSFSFFLFVFRFFPFEYIYLYIYILDSVFFLFRLLFYICFYSVAIFSPRCSSFSVRSLFFVSAMLLLYSCCCYYNEFYIKSFMCRDVLKLGRRFIVAICRSFWIEYCCCYYY